MPPGDLPGLARQPAHPDLLPRGAAPASPPPGPAPARPRRPQGHARDQRGRRRALEETRVGDTRCSDAVIEYAFGTERPLPDDGQPRRGRSIPHRAALVLPHGRGPRLGSVDRSTRSTRPKPRTSRAKRSASATAWPNACIATSPTRAGRERIGPETADRAIGCERCHGPGGHHLAAVAAGFPDPAIVNPASASPQAVTEKQCNDCHILDRNFRDDDRENPGWVRSQGVGWTWSRCNTESGGAFGCVTCHDPHKAPGRPRPRSTRPNASRATRPRRPSPPAGQGRWLKPQRSRNLASAP